MAWTCRDRFSQSHRRDLGIISCLAYGAWRIRTGARARTLNTTMTGFPSGEHSLALGAVLGSLVLANGVDDEDEGI